MDILKVKVGDYLVNNVKNLIWVRNGSIIMYKDKGYKIIEIYTYKFSNLVTFVFESETGNYEMSMKIWEDGGDMGDYSFYNLKEQRKAKVKSIL